MNNKIMILLPKTIYILRAKPQQTIVVDREEYTLYFKNFIYPFSADTMFVRITCDYGANFGDFWRISSFPEDISEFSMTVTVCGGFGEVLSEKTTLIKLVNKMPAAEPFRVLAIGDSFTRLGFYLRHIADKLHNISFIGTRSYNGNIYHEGRGGWCLHDYFTLYDYSFRTECGGVSPFLFPKGVDGKEYAGDIEYLNRLREDTIGNYNLDGFEPQPLREGMIYYHEGKLYRYSRAGSCEYLEQPEFEFSFKKYAQKNPTCMPDAVSVLLGANDLQYDSAIGIKAKVERFCHEMEQFVNSVREYNRTLPVIINLPVLGTPQYAWGMSGMGHGAAEYNLQIRMVAEKLLEKYDGEEGIYISPMLLCIDPVYGYSLGCAVANRYSQAQIAVHTDRLHPNQAGYCQIGDCLAAVIEHLKNNR